MTEVQVYRLPHTLCTDNGRAINQQEPGCEATLTGIPQEPSSYGLTTRNHAVTASDTRSLTFRAAYPVTLGSVPNWRHVILLPAYS
jgi:hypothetical protein